MLNIAEKMKMALLLQSFLLKITFLLIKLEQMHIYHPCNKMLTHQKAGSIFFPPIYCVTQHQLGHSVTPLSSSSIHSKNVKLSSLTGTKRSQTTTLPNY